MLIYYIDLSNGRNNEGQAEKYPLNSLRSEECRLSLTVKKNKIKTFSELPSMYFFSLII